MKPTKQLRTLNDLLAHINKMLAAKGKEPAVLENGGRNDMLWFVVWCSASQMLSDFSAKDLALEMINGIPPMNLARAQEWLDTFWEDLDEDADIDTDDECHPNNILIVFIKELWRI